ncbi:hypothetical protein JMJ58_14965 [Haloterrigena salifodinae]|uniref:Uncharacterized protein n=1 Tax=Haloterrigena salifodinae TaxID=2675099 RepID=A0A8T8DXN1_9EURY|nr:hypothetical protein [Haloterrigena salifodinae]QRV14235.1 hypothetical protein JMJ58_14965 [Haloterrigena salifodinae]
MAKYTGYITWPALTPDRDEGDAEELKEWMEDPFKRKILYSFYYLTELIKIALVSVLVIIGVGTVIVASNITPSETVLFWIAIAVALTIVLFDSLIDNRIMDLSMEITYCLFMGMGQLYFKVKNARDQEPDVEEDAFMTWIDLFPTLEFLRQKERRRLKR